MSQLIGTKLCEIKNYRYRHCLYSVLQPLEGPFKGTLVRPLMDQLGLLFFWSKNKQTNQQTNKSTNKQTNQQTNKSTNTQTNKQTNKPEWNLVGIWILVDFYIFYYLLLCGF